MRGDSPPSFSAPLRFVRNDGRDGKEHTTLTATLESGGETLDPRALVPWALGASPTHDEETPYAGVTCRLHEREAVDAIDPWPSEPREAAVLVRAAMTRAVERAIGSAKRVGLLAGGGLDSGGLVALAAQICRERGGSAFVVALDYEARGDDRPHLRALEAHVGCEVIRVAPEGTSAYASLLEGIDRLPCSLAGESIEIGLMATAKEHGAETLLVGQGGDELFDGDPRALAELVRDGAPLAAVRRARALRDFGDERHPLLEWVVRPLVAPFMPTGLRLAKARKVPLRAPAWCGKTMRSVLEERRAKTLSEAEKIIKGEIVPEPALNANGRVFNAWFRHQLELASGTVRADPYLDRGLVSAIRRLPRAWLLHGDRRRGLFREAMRGLLPESVRLRPDKAWVEPALARWVASAGGFTRFRHLANATHLADLGIVEPRPLMDAFEVLAADPIERYDEWNTVWPAIAVEAFLRARTGKDPLRP